MDVFLIIIGVVFIVTGVKKKPNEAERSGWHTLNERQGRGWLALIIAGSVITFFGALWFSAAFIAGYIRARGIR